MQYSFSSTTGWKKEDGSEVLDADKVEMIVGKLISCIAKLYVAHGNNHLSPEYGICHFVFHLVTLRNKGELQ